MVKSIIEYVKEWIPIVNSKYNEQLKFKEEMKQKAIEKERLEVIERINKENELNDFINLL